ncbi:MAG: hypothetical protein NTY39_05565 [Campylobacterales bacterium]|nr:hypothetical protein [Campylobacterales bacterium]
MIKITHPDLSKLAQEHYEKLKSKIKIFPTCNYALEEVMTAKPEKLHEIALHYKNDTNFNFMKALYENFSNKKKEYDAYDLAESLQIDVCPYCNRNYTFTIKSKSGSTRPQFDHFYDKATYPILALSFYNLIPCCPTCNSTMKGSTPFSITTHLHPYQDSFNDHAKFSLKIQNSNFYYDENGFDVKIETKEPKAQKIIDDFALQTLYDEHKDITLELIQKAEIYNESYIDELMQKYDGTLFKNREDLLRLITCGYITDEEISKRPLSKLIKDISEELELI